MFRQNPDVAMIGPQNIRLPLTEHDLQKSWGKNKANTLKLIVKLGLSTETDDLRSRL